MSTTFRVDGLDLEPAFIEIARRKVPASMFSVADMRRFDLGKRYDVVMCLFSSIGYLTQEGEVVEAFSCFADHLADGGVIIVEPWFTPEAWQVGRPGMAPPVDRPDIKICRVNAAGRRGDVSLIDFHYLIATPETSSIFTKTTNWRFILSTRCWRASSGRACRSRTIRLAPLAEVYTSQGGPRQHNQRLQPAAAGVGHEPPRLKRGR